MLKVTQLLLAVALSRAGGPPVGSDGGPARTSRDGDEGRAPEKFEEVLRKAAGGADSLQLVQFPYDGLEGAPLVVVNDASEVQALLGAIETQRGYIGQHWCDGWPVTRLFSGKALLAELSFDHVQIVRALSKNLRLRFGDVAMTPKSVRAVADWFEQHGYSEYRAQLEREESEAARRQAFFAVFPKDVQHMLRSANALANGMITFGSGRPRASAHQADAGVPDDPIAAAIPDDVERVRIICRGLGVLGGHHDGLTAAEQVVLESAGRVSPATIATAVDGFVEGSPELRGAAQLLFPGPAEQGGGLLSLMDKTAARRIAARVAQQALLEDNASPRGSLIWALGDYPGDETDKVLSIEASRARDAPEGTCKMTWEELAPLSAFVILTERRRASMVDVDAVAQRPWKCPLNAAAARLALAIACEKSPAPEDLAAVSKRMRAWWKRVRPDWPMVSALNDAGPAPDGAPAAAPSSCKDLDGPARKPKTSDRAARPESPPAFGVEGLPVARTTAEVAADGKFRRAVRLASEFDRLTLKVKRSAYVREARPRKDAAARAAQKALFGACEDAPEIYCLATDHANGLLFEKYSDALLDAPCQAIDVQLGTCDGAQDADRIFLLGFATSWYRAALRRCEKPELAEDRLCMRAREGLRRAGAKGLQ